MVEYNRMEVERQARLAELAQSIPEDIMKQIRLASNSWVDGSELFHGFKPLDVVQHDHESKRYE